MIHIWEVFTGYEELRKAQAADPAWAADDGATNYRLKDLQKVVLQCRTLADSSTGGVLLGAGSEGVIIWARAPRVTQPRVRRPCTFLYFAVVKFIDDSGIYRARVPHNAIKAASRAPSPQPKENLS